MDTCSEVRVRRAMSRASARRAASRESLIDYKDFNRELAESTGLPTFSLATGPGRADISQLLVRVHERYWEEGNDYMLTSLVKLTGENYPGKGFFTLAQQEGLYDPMAEPEVEFWQRQVGLAHQAHQPVRPSRGLTDY